VCGRLDTGGPGRILTVSSGGHPLPLVLRADGRLDTVGRPGTLLGVFPEPDLAEEVVTLGPGDALVLYTDGVTEERIGTRVFGHEGLTATLATCRGLAADGIAEAIEQAVMEFQPDAPRDDLALLVLRVAS
jgi:serine phosphatase RsbU (regulator of sigma subunit)